MSAEAIATGAAAVGLLAVLLPLLLTIRADVGEVRRDLHALAERVARIEGALTGPWRPPANGPPPGPEPVATPTAAGP